jgi:3-oxoacyl-(acyl-carrier-protein) synthase
MAEHEVSGEVISGVVVQAIGLATAAGRGWAALKDALEAGRPLPPPERSAEALLLEALEDAALAPLPQDAGLIFATASGGLGDDWAPWHTTALAGDASPPPARPRLAPGDALAARLGVLGPRANVSLACASGTAALGMALDWLQAGRARVVVVAAVDVVCPFVSAGFEALKLVDPQGCRPLTPGSRGFHLGAAAAILVLAVGEGGVQLTGAASSQDAWHPLTPHPEGRGLIDAARLALARGGGHPAQLVSTHGTGTPANDQAEAAALRTLFGEERPPLQALKPVVGHSHGRRGARRGRGAGVELGGPTASVLAREQNLGEGAPHRDLLVHGLRRGERRGGLQP